MTPAAVATALLIAGGIAGVGWMLWPMLKPDPVQSDPDEPEDEPDAPPVSPAVLRIQALLDRGVADDDAPREWTRWQAMLPDAPRRIDVDLAPAERLPILRTADQGVLVVPIASAVLEVADPPDDLPPVLRGRRQGRAFHAVELACEANLYLDLVEVLRVLPVIGVELEARGIADASLTVELVDGAEADALVAGGEVSAVAAWLAGMDSPRVVPDPDGAEGVRSWHFAIEVDGSSAGTLGIRAEMAPVADGIARDHLPWAGVATWESGERIVESGATPQDVVARVVADTDLPDPDVIWEASQQTWAWSGLELAELAAVGHYLTEEGIDVLRLVEDAFADGSLPKPDLHDEAQSLTAAAVLNWVGVVHRRGGYPNRAIGLLDAALVACAPDDDDNRADIHYNRGYARLQTAMVRAPEPTGPGDLHLAVFPVLSDEEIASLETARQDFALAARLNPNDPHAWSQQAVIHQLRGENDAASDAWLQAATRTRDEDVQRQLRDNAAAVAAGEG
jgi:tetratricopeptide (TPR) repeat protein